MQDSAKMRRRVASAIDGNDRLGGLSEFAKQELGIATPWSSNLSWRAILEKWALQDVLDLITVATRFLVQEQNKSRYHLDYVAPWINTVARILAEENVHYAVDRAGGVHFAFDKEFSTSQAATIAALNATRYRNSLDLFESALADLGQAPPNTKSAVRHVFFAIEGLFKLMFPSETRLTAKAAELLKPVLQKQLSEDKTTLQVSLKLIESFKDWIDAAHFYRHEQGEEDIAMPPLTVAVHLASAGAANLRWLAEIDAQLQS
ncbi:hypothetical protein [Bradyrhizobium sp. CCBAU 45384]|uniref:hypothetical protein n=1 Tax=Bradyrhizobium sp. CCBAU 45384 TaxID=858428 RepID=UPI0023064A55|nr:hypothetical protein [Bradyrhizobium sp. CCBAU 45384]MDA9408741.1 hypothetical protein [Bradyrhizobium sp. CCBAU 45384]